MDSNTSQRQVLFSEEKTLRENDSHPPYIDYAVTVPSAASRVGAVLTYHKAQRSTQIYLALFDPEQYRGTRMKPGEMGDIELELWVIPTDASLGAIPGELPAGVWQARIDVQQVAEDVTYKLVFFAEFETVSSPVDFTFPENHVVKSDAGWYRGELHSHSTESDGKYPVETVIEAAVEANLDYIAITDHFTVSHWRKLVPHLAKPIALLRSCEITSHYGHANVHGIREWVNVYVDEPEYRMNDAADATHAQNGLFCVNHAYSGKLAWQDVNFDWSKTDLFEIHHNLEGANNHAQLALWERLIAQGHRIVGIAGIDSHDPYTGNHKLGQLVTWIYADHLSETGIVEGLRRGQVYVSKGPEVRFYATSGEQQAHMWESLAVNGSDTIKLTVEVRTAIDLRMFVIKNGLLYQTSVIGADGDTWQTLIIDDTPTSSGYYRIELHAIHEDSRYRGIEWRTFDTVQVLTNPVLVDL